jgi:hypothetical protein
MGQLAWPPRQGLSRLARAAAAARPYMHLLLPPEPRIRREGFPSSALNPLSVFFRLTWRMTLCRWSLGSALFLASWAVMMGPWAYVQHLISTPRLPFTAAYFGSIALTLYFSLGVSALCQR